VADQRAWRRAARPTVCRLVVSRALQRLVARGLALEWSPQQIAGWLRRRFPDNPDMQISHETIYVSLYVQARGALKHTLTQHLRRRHAMRRPKQAVARAARIRDLVSIAERPPEVADRAVPGHWEGDLIRGAHYSHIATLVERHSRYVLLIRILKPDATTVTRALARRVKTLPASLRGSLTWDRGTEMAAHRAFTIATNVQVYFCDPGRPWQRGSNENTNGLLRQYFPAGTDLSQVTQAQLDRIALRLNTRPRKTLGYETPAERLAAAVAMTA
jgi:IS30 family transposase